MANSAPPQDDTPAWHRFRGDEGAWHGGSWMSVTPYWELTFDADGDVDGPERDHLLAQVTDHGSVT